MKSFFTTIIAVCLFTLCLFEKEAKKQALEAQKIREKSSENQLVNNQSTSLPAYAGFKNNRSVQAQFQLAQFVSSDSLNNTTQASESL